MSPKMTPSGQQGSILVYLVVGLVAFGLLALAGASRYGSSVTSVSTPNCAIAARHMSESGMRYAMARLRSCSTLADVTAAVSAMNGATYTVDSAHGLTFTLAASYDSSTGLATVSSSGRGCTSAMSTVTATTSSSSINLPAVSSGGGSASSSAALQGTYSGTSAIVAGSTTGNIATSSASISGGSVVGGSVIYLGTGPTCLSISGGAVVGTAGNSNYVCSNTCVVVDGGATVYGDIYAQGDVTVASTVYGDIYSGGDVTLNWGAVVSGNIYCTGTFSKPAYFTSYKGTVTTGYAAPSQCVAYTLPAHKALSPKSALTVTGTYTFFGTTDLADTTNAFTSITGKSGSKICFDLSTANTSINIFSSGSMTVNGEVYVRTSTATNCFDSANRVSNINFANYAAASRVYMDVGGTVTFGGGSNWFGTVYAAGNIYPGGGGSYIGAFYTNSAYNPYSTWSYSRFVASDYVAAYWP